MPLVARRLARAYVERTPALPNSAVASVVSRWAARLSALLLLGNAAVFRFALPEPRVTHGFGGAPSPLPQLSPEGESTYELLVA